ncbi:transporter [Luteitalea sp. TBR-22]|uniref:DUF6691 family protein n=1 Tax=Luteitalea sp. TBR-22 TaxID=2802971 RepID=UPI001AF356BC|nr:DUF6691 family protein [Luteitalea sp. TBR-22]BCS34925.1 transporter [Luteitalea sp. TBR-22]
MNAPLDSRQASDGRGATAQAGQARRDGVREYVGYVLAGTALGILFMQAQVLSWFRIQEMFRFQSLHMFGIIGVAIAVAVAGRWTLTRLAPRSAAAQAIANDAAVEAPPMARHLLGGIVFGLGWALLGACPGPIFTLIGAGRTEYVVALAAATAGTWAYGHLQSRLP